MKRWLIILSLFSFWAACSSGLTETEKKFVGTWRMQNYTSNEVVPPEQKAAYDANIANLKSRFRLILLEDKTFLRDGFAPTTETGEWSINPQGTLLNFKGQDGKAGTVFVEKNDGKEMIFSIEEGQTKVKLTLVKIAD